VRKLARSFFWIDQELLRSGLWLKLSVVERLVYIALAASVNRDGVSLWGSEKLLTLASCTKLEWEESIAKLIEYNLIQPPQSGEVGIILLSFDRNQDEEQSQKSREAMNAKKSSNLESRLPIIIKTTTTVELGEVSAKSKDSK
jgi:hypothetical protein